MLFDKNERELLTKVSEWGKRTEFPILLGSLRQAEKEGERATKIVKREKAKIGRLFSEGLLIKGDN